MGKRIVAEITSDTADIWTQFRETARIRDLKITAALLQAVRLWLVDAYRAGEQIAPGPIPILRSPGDVPPPAPVLDRECAFKNPHAPHTNQPGEADEWQCPGVVHAPRPYTPEDGR